jgi:hypothetical protein
LGILYESRPRARVASVDISQYADLGDVVNMLRQHRRDEIHDGE